MLIGLASICKLVFTSICLLELSCRLLLSHSVPCTSNYYIINENKNKIKYSATVDAPAHLLFHYTTPPLKLSHPRGFYNSLFQSPMFLISSSSCCFIHKNRLWLTLANGFLFHHCQFSFNLFQYFCSYFFSPHLYNNFVIYFPSNSLLNTFFSSSISCYCIFSSFSFSYSFSNSFTRSLAFLRFSLPSQMFSSAVHPFHHTRYSSFPCTHLLFIIFSISYFSFPSIITGYDFFFFCSSICPIYLHILLTLTTGCIFTMLGSSNSIAFVETIALTL